MEQIDFEVSIEQLQEWMKLYPNMGKNSHIGNIAVKVVEMYFKSLDENAKCRIGKNGPDLVVDYGGKTEEFEVKGTADKSIAWSKLKVSSVDSYNALRNGLTLVRVTNVGGPKMKLYFMKFGMDFDLIEEARWSVKKIRG